MTRFGGLGNDAKQFLRRMKAVALAKGRYRPGIDQEFIKKWRENIACSVARANALNVHVSASVFWPIPISYFLALL